MWHNTSFGGLAITWIDSSSPFFLLFSFILDPRHSGSSLLRSSCQSPLHVKQQIHSPTDRLTHHLDTLGVWLFVGFRYVAVFVDDDDDEEGLFFFLLFTTLFFFCWLKICFTLTPPFP